MNFEILEKFIIDKFKGTMFKIFYFTAYPKNGTRDPLVIEKIHKFLTRLKKGFKFIIVKKQLKIINQFDKDGNIVTNQTTGEPLTKEKGNLDVEITIDAIRYSSAYDIAVFFTGDSDFLPLVSYLRNLKSKKKVYIFSTEGSISNELKTGTDGYFDLADYPELFSKSLK